VGWARDGRDSLIYPTTGSVHRANAEVGIPGGNLNYYRLQYQYQRYFPLTRTYTFFINGDVGYGDGYSDTPTLPFFKNFYAGGVSSVRGYRAYTIGPKDVTGAPRGGSQRVNGNAEFLMPFPGLENDKSVRVSAFFDAGNVGDTFDAGLTRYSAGLAVLWVSPLGPLKISAAQPFNDQPDDKIQRFQFTFGSNF
jgi:outer membrane protein insertion porin family